MSDDIEIGCQTPGCVGCLGIVLMLGALWALIFGITWDGQHYGLSCTRERGVEPTIEPTDPP